MVEQSNTSHILKKFNSILIDWNLVGKKKMKTIINVSFIVRK